MLAVERRKKINEMLIVEKSVNAVDMAEHFNVSSQTIRRDFQILEEQGALVRTHGGAYLKEGVISNISINLRKTMIRSGKVAIAKQSISFIKDGDSVFLDNSTTALTIARKLPNINITIVTNSLLISEEVAKLPNVELITVGGILNKVNMCYVGKAAREMMSNYFVDKAFISSSTLSMKNGIVDSNEEVAAVRSIAIGNAVQKYLIVDHTKFGKTSLVSVCEYEDINAIITDEDPGAEWQEFLKTKRINLYYSDSIYES